jgi:hypothetical protein
MSKHIVHISAADLMRTFFFRIGLVVVVIGVVFPLGVLMTTPVQRLGVVIWLGLCMSFAGLAISYFAKHRECPTCLDHVKYEASRCKHCGQEFRALAQQTTTYSSAPQRPARESSAPEPEPFPEL